MGSIKLMTPGPNPLPGLGEGWGEAPPLGCNFTLKGLMGRPRD